MFINRKKIIKTLTFGIRLQSRQRIKRKSLKRC